VERGVLMHNKKILGVISVLLLTLIMLVSCNKVTYTLIGINILIYIITAIMSRNIFDSNTYVLIILGAKVNELINYGQVWRLLTCAFLHGGIMHLAFNMYSLKIIGSEIEYIFGRKKYLIIYLMASVGGSIFSYIFSPYSISVGASGAIFGLLGAMLVFGIKHRNKIGKGYMMNIIQVIGINIFIGITLSNIDNFGHIGGLIVGGITALLVKSKLDKLA
jgi:rhomboid protease GluP